MKEAKQQPDADQCGMYLFHNGVVRGTAKAQVRHGENSPRVTGMQFSFDQKKVDAAVQRIKKMPGIFHVRAWLNSGTMQVGDDLMLLLVGGDIRPHVVGALQALLDELKSICVKEQEHYE